MKKATLPVRIGNEIAVDTYAADIKKELTIATSSWKRVAELFAAAQDQFGRNSKAMKELASMTDFTKSKIDKLVQIAKDRRIKKHANMFNAVSAWTVLYDVTLLNEEQFIQLTHKLEIGETLTSKLVNSIRKPKAEQNLANLQSLASIQIDINAIRAGLFEHEDYEELIVTLENLASRIPYIKIMMNDVLSQDIKKQEKEVLYHFDRIVRRNFSEVRTKYLNRLSRKINDRDMKELKSELMETTDSLLSERQFEEAFCHIDSDEFDEERFWQEAQSKMWGRREEKFKDRVTNPYENTNLILLDKAA
jgi:hypothetical protein